MLKIPLLFALAQHPQRTLLRRLRKVKFFLGVCIFLSANGLTTAYVDAQLQNGLVGYWSFNEGSGTIAGDSSGNGNTATLVNGPTWIASGAIAGALSFDGIDDCAAGQYKWRLERRCIPGNRSEASAKKQQCSVVTDREAYIYRKIDLLRARGVSWRAGSCASIPYRDVRSCSTRRRCLGTLV